MNRRKKSGFTLVELLVVISVITILSSLGFATYVNFNRTQVIVQTADRIISDLRLAQSLAANNQRPPDNENPESETGLCGSNPLVGYSFKINSEKNYTIFAICGPNPLPVKEVTVPSVITIGPTGWEAIFKVLRQGVSRPPSNITVNTVKEIIVGEGGEIRLK